MTKEFFKSQFKRLVAIYRQDGKLSPELETLMEEFWRAWKQYDNEVVREAIDLAIVGGVNAREGRIPVPEKFTPFIQGVKDRVARERRKAPEPYRETDMLELGLVTLITATLRIRYNPGTGDRDWRQRMVELGDRKISIVDAFGDLWENHGRQRSWVKFMESIQNVDSKLARMVDQAISRRRMN